MIKIGLVLSGGGARGLAQIGVLKVLKKNNIKINSIAGCSMGALVGACYAHDDNPEKIEKLWMKIIKSKSDLYDYAFSTKGLIKGIKLESYIAEYFSDSKNTKIKFEFKDLSIPTAINATDIVRGEEIIFDKGPLVPAIMASLSYPGFFTTRKINEKICVDGGVINPLPINLINDADYLILVDVSCEYKKITEDSNFKDIILQASLMMQKTIVEKNIQACKKKFILIRPKVEQIGIFDFNKPSDIVSLGEKEALSVIDRIKKDIEELEQNPVKKML